ncbi:hypothetical protein FA95DRAFT_1229497 [Auriscalpium vulgare]|uniref:Uncharacterized protein n=1 Tax=Auriscalpium vulgare TaxID=40419 RepID=A0ACB8R3H1_9AGAM|nr:hypothetical protein FA95DRAFT_1229497 [Auriscalpium vulgare]
MLISICLCPHSSYDNCTTAPEIQQPASPPAAPLPPGCRACTSRSTLPARPRTRPRSGRERARGSGVRSGASSSSLTSVCVRAWIVLGSVLYLLPGVLPESRSRINAEPMAGMRIDVAAGFAACATIRGRRRGSGCTVSTPHMRMMCSSTVSMPRRPRADHDAASAPPRHVSSESSHVDVDSAIHHMITWTPTRCAPSRAGRRSRAQRTGDPDPRRGWVRMDVWKRKARRVASCSVCDAWPRSDAIAIAVVAGGGALDADAAAGIHVRSGRTYASVCVGDLAVPVRLDAMHARCKPAASHHPTRLPTTHRGKAKHARGDEDVHGPCSREIGGGRRCDARGAGKLSAGAGFGFAADRAPPPAHGSRAACS